MTKGRIVQVMGPVVDVEFNSREELPFIKDDLEVDIGVKRCVMEVAQHVGNNIARCIMLASSEGLQKGMEVTATGAGIKVPVGEKTLGRLFNVLGETIDNGEPIKDSEEWVIHRKAPSFEEQSPAVEVLETGIKDIDLEIQTLYNKNIKKVRFLIRKGDDFMPLVVQDIIYEFTKEIKKIFGTNLSTVIVYGSYARGDYNENSDVDVMILVKIPEEKLSNYIDVVSDCAFEYLMKYGIDISPVLKNENHFKYWEETIPYYQNIRKEGVVICD